MRHIVPSHGRRDRPVQNSSPGKRPAFLRRLLLQITLLSLLEAAAFLRPSPSANAASPLPADSLAPHVLVGYWHNFINQAGTLRLSAVPNVYDVIIVAFAEPTTIPGATIRFVPDGTIYPDSADFKRDVALLKAKGKRVMVSVGGANAVVKLQTEADIDSFVESVDRIISTYGFDGLDIDFESQSIALDPGDTDFRAPTSATVVHLIDAIRRIAAQYPAHFLLTFAPETIGVQGGFSAYGSVFGAYLPVIYALRDKITFVQVQHYNTGAMSAPDGHVYTPGSADFHVAMADMLLAGFPVNSPGGTLAFPPLKPDQVVIGLPASPEAAQSGYSSPAVVDDVLQYLLKGRSFGGVHVLSAPTGYPTFRGIMTWSINWDVAGDTAFSRNVRRSLDTLATVTGIEQRGGEGPSGISSVQMSEVFPNPLNGSGTVRFTLPRRARVNLTVYDILGRKVLDLLNGVRDPGDQQMRFSALGLASGVYFYRLRVRLLDPAVSEQVQIRKVIITK